MNDAALDVDGDGFSNLHEFQAGTDPRDRDSALRVSAIRSGTGATYIQFTAAAHKSYRVLCSDSLRARSWEILESVPASSTDRLVEIDQPSAATCRYYQVELRTTW
jgi:hypothetical protein